MSDRERTRFGPLYLLLFGAMVLIVIRLVSLVMEGLS